MQISPLTFREFDSAALPAKEIRKKPFATQKKEEEPEAPPPPPTFSEEQLHEAERDAYKRGFLEGTKEGHATAQGEHSEVQRILMEGLENFITSVVPIFDQYRKHCQQMRMDMPTLALAIARKIAGEALSEPAQYIVDEAAKHCAEALISEPEITIMINPRLAEALAFKLKQIGSREKIADNITIIPEEAIDVSNYRIEWKNGSIERSTEKLWQQTDKAINNMIAAIAGEPEEQLDLLNPPNVKEE